MGILELELWTALYLLAGVGTYLCYKHIIEETTDDQYAHGLVALMVIALWWLLLLLDLGGWLLYHCYTKPKVKIGWRLDLHWVKKHKAHGTVTSWCGSADGIIYWTCSCDPRHRYYPNTEQHL